MEGAKTNPVIATSREEPFVRCITLSKFKTPSMVMVYLINQLNPLVFKSLGSLFSLGLHNTLPSTCLMDIIDSEKTN